VNVLEPVHQSVSWPTLGTDDALTLGELLCMKDGEIVGATLGVLDGVSLGYLTKEGDEDGSSLGKFDGSKDGTMLFSQPLGTDDALTLGELLCMKDGEIIGATLGALDGVAVGYLPKEGGEDGSPLGEFDGNKDGTMLGKVMGEEDGDLVRARQTALSKSLRKELYISLLTISRTIVWKREGRALIRTPSYIMKRKSAVWESTRSIPFPINPEDTGSRKFPTVTLKPLNFAS